MTAKGGLNMTRDVQQAHIGMMVRCPHTFDHIVDLSTASNKTVYLSFHFFFTSHVLRSGNIVGVNVCKDNGGGVCVCV